MTIAVGQHRGMSGDTFTFASTPTVGNIVVIAGMTNFGHVAPGAPTGFSGTTTGPNSTGGVTSDDYCGMWFKRYASGDTNSFTVANLGGSFGVYGWELTGASTGSFLYAIGTNPTTPAGTSMPISTAPGTTPTEDSVALTVMAANALFTSPAVAGFGDCEKVINPGAVAWETFVTAQTNLSFAWSWTNSVKPVGVGMVFLGTDVPSPPPSSTLPVFLNVGSDWVPGEELFNDGGAWV